MQCYSSGKVLNWGSAFCSSMGVALGLFQRPEEWRRISVSEGKGVLYAWLSL